MQKLFLQASESFTSIPLVRNFSRGRLVLLTILQNVVNAVFKITDSLYSYVFSTG